MQSEFQKSIFVQGPDESSSLPEFEFSFTAASSKHVPMAFCEFKDVFKIELECFLGSIRDEKWS